MPRRELPGLEFAIDEPPVGELADPVVRRGRFECFSGPRRMALRASWV